MCFRTVRCGNRNSFRTYVHKQKSHPPLQFSHHPKFEILVIEQILLGGGVKELMIPLFCVKYDLNG